MLVVNNCNCQNLPQHLSCRSVRVRITVDQFCNTSSPVWSSSLTSYQHVLSNSEQHLVIVRGCSCDQSESETPNDKQIGATIYVNKV